MTEADNLEIGLFLRRLKSILESTEDQPDETLSVVVTLLSSYAKRHFKDSNENDIRNFMEDTNFVFKRNILCRSCDKSFEMTQAAFNIHISSEQHNNGGTTTNIQDQNHETSVSPVRSESSLNNEAKSKNSFDLTKPDDFFELVKFEANNLSKRSSARKASETKIIEVITKYVKAYNVHFNVYQYGSTTFGFGGSVDLNILVDTSKADVAPLLAMHEFKKMIDKNDFGNHFTNVTKTHADRVITQQLKMIHEESTIRCTICFELGPPSPLVWDILSIDSSYFHLVAYIKAWQTVLNKQNTKELFDFNTYTIAVMTIAVLQRDLKLPPIDELSKLHQTNKLPKSTNTSKLTELFKEFLLFFGSKYERNVRLITPFVPHFLNIKTDRLQKCVPPAEKIVRDYMNANPSNWKNCSLFIQDPINHGINITAEIPDNKVIAFQKQCRQFHDAITKKRIIISMDMTNDSNSLAQRPSCATSDNKSQSNTNKPQANETQRPPHPSAIVATPTNTSFNFESIEAEAKQYLNRSSARIQSEIQIIELITKYATLHNNKFIVYQHGSTTYGFGGPVDLNVFINTGESNANSSEAVREFKHFIDITDRCEHFDKAVLQPANRVVGQRITLFHKQSELWCSISFGASPPSTIVRDILVKNRSYLYLVAYVKAWQTVLNKLNRKSLFYFNSYAIAVMVIAVLQRQSIIPAITEIPKWLKSHTAEYSGDIRKMLMEFLKFYGDKYERNKRVISPFTDRFVNIQIDPRHSTNKAAELFYKQSKIKPDNWTNCSFFIQDLADFSVNVTAAIPETEAATFQRQCIEYHRILQERAYTFCSAMSNSTIAPPSAPLVEARSIENRSKNKNYDELSEGKILIETADLLARTTERIGYENIILRTLKSALMGFDSMLEITPFGSSVYGFGGAKTNVNLFINATKSSQHNTNDLIDSLRTYLRLPRFINDFKEIKYIPRNRVLKPQLIILHKISNIECVLISEDMSLIKVTKLIENYNNIEPMCLHITAVVKAVQLITNEFEFNSYIIYVLVIFFLQMNYDLPQTTNLAAKYTKTNKELGSMIYEFFHFYAKKYQNKSHIISARFGRWQQRKLNPAHRVFDDEMKKLRGYIDQYPQNWDVKCAMYVQDLVRLQTNITAEIPIADLIAFQDICAKLMKKFDGVWNKTNKAKSTKNGHRPTESKTEDLKANIVGTVKKESTQAPNQEHKVGVVSQYSTDRLQSLPEAENETEEEAEPALPKDILRLQLHSLNKTLINAQSQITGKKIAFSVENTNSNKSGIVPSLSQVRVHLLKEHLSIADAENTSKLNNAESSTCHDLAETEMSSHESVIKNSNKYVDETKTDSVAIEFNIENKSSHQAEPPNNMSDIFIPKTISPPCPIELLSFVRTKERVFEEAAILATLKGYMGPSDQNTYLLRVGSVFYRIASQKSDFNILVLTKNSLQSDDICNLFGARINGIDSEFKSIETSIRNQGHKSVLRMVHKKFGIRCSLHFDSPELAKAAEMILRIIEFKPIVGELIKKILAWQQSAIETLSSYSLPYFEFNSYTIAILVIFSMQMTHLLPTHVSGFFWDLFVEEEQDSQCDIQPGQLSTCLFAFFNLYGNEYDMKENVVSVNAGKWLQNPLEPLDGLLLMHQEILHDSILDNPGKWVRSAMHMQDIVDTGLNVTAQVTKNAAEQFQKMCKMFAAKEYCDELASK